MKDRERAHRQFEFPPLTEEQKKEIEELRKMNDEKINFNDIPHQGFSDTCIAFQEACSLEYSKFSF